MRSTEERHCNIDLSLSPVWHLPGDLRFHHFDWILLPLVLRAMQLYVALSLILNVSLGAASIALVIFYRRFRRVSAATSGVQSPLPRPSNPSCTILECVSQAQVNELSEENQPASEAMVTTVAAIQIILPLAQAIVLVILVRCGHDGNDCLVQYGVRLFLFLSATTALQNLSNIVFFLALSKRFRAHIIKKLRAALPTCTSTE